MKPTRILGGLVVLLWSVRFAPAVEPVRYLRFHVGTTTAYGILEGTRVRELSGEPFSDCVKTERTYELSDVKLLPPTKPTQVLAMAGNYRSHLRDAQTPAKFAVPQPFYKSPSCLIATDDAIVIPQDATVVHAEAELVIVIGKTCCKVAEDNALDYVFGVTAGNDVSERIWQNDEQTKDIQWWRAKGADTFGPVGPYIATGLNYGDLMLQLRVNGQVKQQERTDQLIHDIPTIVSYISQYVTLHPGDLIFTGTPGETPEIRPGDTLEIELEGVGVLHNPVVKKP